MWAFRFNDSFKTCPLVSNPSFMEWKAHKNIIIITKFETEITANKTIARLFRSLLRPPALRCPQFPRPTTNPSPTQSLTQVSKLSNLCDATPSATLINSFLLKLAMVYFLADSLFRVICIIDIFHIARGGTHDQWCCLARLYDFSELYCSIITVCLHVSSMAASKG